MESKKLKIKQSTLAKYSDTLQRYLKPLEGLQARKLNQAILENFFLSLSQKLSSKTLHDVLSMVKQILKYGEKKGYLPKFDYDFENLPKQGKTETRILTTEEQQKLFNHLLLNTTLEKLGILLGLCLGLRIGEVCALTMQDIDLANGVLKVNKTLQRIKDMRQDAPTKTRIVIDSPKSQSSNRVLPLSPFLVGLIARVTKRLPSTAYLLTGTRHYIEPRTLENKLKGHLKACGLNGDEIHYHTLRHTFATNAIQKADVKTVSELLGHASVAFTLGVYVHPSEALKRDCIEQASMSYLCQSG